MNKDELLNLLNNVKEGSLAVDIAAKLIQNAPYEDLGYAKVDHHRGLQQGIAEVIYGQGKTAEQIEGICNAMLNKGDKNILVTRVLKDVAEYLCSIFSSAEYYESAKLCVVNPCMTENPLGKVVIVSAGTSDLLVCEEAALTAEYLGSKVERLYDAGVSGIHRLLSNLDMIEDARVIIAVAGMEGALASVVGGLASCPVIAVPTSVGYGANFGGISALLSMLNSCAGGVSVVNIDNGFGAGYLAHMINTMKGLE